MNKEIPKREWQSNDGKKAKGETLLPVAASTLAVLLVVSGVGFAWADTTTDGSDVAIKATDAIKNSPTAMKILENIELFKQRYAALQQKQQLVEEQHKLIEQQRQLANEYLQNDLASMNNFNNQNLPRNAYAAFVSTVNNSAQSLFWDQFGFMQDKISKANEAKNSVLKSGGSIDAAWEAYNDALAIHHTDLVNTNKNLNVKYHFADERTQNLFNNNGKLR